MDRPRLKTRPDDATRHLGCQSRLRERVEFGLVAISSVAIRPQNARNATGLSPLEHRALQRYRRVVGTGRMAEKPTKSKSGSGCLGKLLALFLLACAVGLGAAAYFVAVPQDLSDLGGYGPQVEGAPARDMKVVLRNAVDRGFAVSLSEAEINRWLAKTLVTKQGGPLGAVIGLERVWVRLKEGHAEVIMERRIKEQVFTVSMFLTPELLQGPTSVEKNVHLHGGPYHENLPRPMRGGRFGRLVVPQGFLLLVIPAYKNLAAVFKDEIHLGFEEMARIRIENRRLILDPKGPEADISGLPETF